MVVRPSYTSPPTGPNSADAQAPAGRELRPEHSLLVPDDPVSGRTWSIAPCTSPANDRSWAQAAPADRAVGDGLESTGCAAPPGDVAPAHAASASESSSAATRRHAWPAMRRGR